MSTRPVFPPGDAAVPPADAAEPGTDNGGASAPSWAEDWITLWQSELAGLLTDREAQEGWVALLALWANAARAMAAASARPPSSHDRPAGSARPAAPPGAAPAAAAPDAANAELRRLSEHIIELERRLAELEHPTRRPARPSRKRRAKPPKPEP